MSNKPAVLSPLFSEHRKFTDIDEFSEARSGWDRDYRQLEKVNSCMSIEVIASPNVSVHHLHFPFSLHQCGAAPAGFTTIGLPFEESSLSWVSKESSSAVIVDFNNPNGYEGVSGAGFRGIAISISDATLSHCAARMGLQTSFAVSRDQVRLRSGGEEKLDWLRDHLRFLCSRSVATMDPQDTYWLLSELENEVPVQLLTSLADLQPPQDDLPLWARQKGLRLAIQFIENNAHENPRLPNICTASNLSWRSLDRVFKEYFGIGPKRYLLQFRLIRVRQQLKTRSPDTRISDIANPWGFWHMGDFAQKYRRFFGELPAAQRIK